MAAQQHTDNAPHFGFTPGDVIVVTGAGSGIGKATALSAGQHGLTVAAWGRDEDAVITTAREIVDAGGAATALTADLAILSDIEKAIKATRNLGTIRHVANIAGPPSSVDLDFDEALNLCVGSMRWVVSTWLEHGAPEGASVVNVASLSGNVFGTGSDWYSAAKAAITGWTRHLAAYRSEAVRANVIAPGMIETPMIGSFVDSLAGQRALERIPLHRMGTPDEVANVILFALSPLATYLNGAFIPVDGGWAVSP